MKAKPILIVLGSILIGIIAGFLISAQLRHKRMESVRVMSSERHFREVLYRAIEPDEELKSQLEPILERYGKEGRELQKEFRSSFEIYNENYWSEIKALLTVDQLEKLEEFSKKREEEMRRFRSDTSRGNRGKWEGRRGPPQGGRRGGHRGDTARIMIDSFQIADTLN